MRHYTFKDIPFFPSLSYLQRLDKNKNQLADELYKEALQYYQTASTLNSQLFEAESELIKLRAENAFMLKLVNDRSEHKVKDPL